MSKNRYEIRRLIFVGVVTLLSGCSVLNTEQTFSTKKNEIALPEHWQASNKYINDDFTKQLLGLIDQQTVTTLVQEALAANYDLKVTAARLKQSHQLYKKSQLKTLPTVNANYKTSRAKDGTISNSQTLSLDLSWELDVWGRLSDASNAADASYKASELDYLYAKNSLAARVIQACLDINYRAHIIRIQQQWVTSLVHTEEIIHEQVIDGDKEQADLDTAKASTEQVRATLATTEHEQILAIRNLNLLRGFSSKELDTLSLNPITIKAPPTQMPGDVIGSRPDLIAAYQRIVAADNNTSVAYKQLLPKFTLTASISRTGNSLSQMHDNPSAWSLISGITAPLFNRDSLKTSAQITQLNAQITYLNYQKLLLNALTEVENAFDKEASLKERKEHLNKAYIHSYASMCNYQNLYQDGGSNILSLLHAKQSAFQAQIQLLQIEQARFSNRITLGLALGMGV